MLPEQQHCLIDRFVTIETTWAPQLSHDHFLAFLRLKQIYILVNIKVIDKMSSSPLSYVSIDILKGLF
ncbi:protein of unknown function [Xenorhabdus poinarii G6]|uniref:Uncharacterized protein n=1 Tax=Xenorhabdus poinarii G6 TaxID=1354304 RepID=A0A068R3V1_9GAMM|nr:protein of unknown function [Xenorhabdus poinarii G6]